MHPLSIAQAASAHSAVAGAATVSVAGLFIQMVVGLGVVLGVIAVITKLVRGKGRMGVGLGRRSTPITVLGRQALGKGVQVAVVRVGARTFFLGITPGSVNQLSELAADDFNEPEHSEAASPLVSGQHWPLARTTSSTPGQSPPTWMSTIERLRDITARRV